ncbi:MAG: hypothetical protein ACI9WC_000001 [Arenicella sp.]|jgi:hypothetical protein
MQINAAVERMLMVLEFHRVFSDGYVGTPFHIPVVEVVWARFNEYLGNQ